jgi:hypothetical protein
LRFVGEKVDRYNRGYAEAVLLSPKSDITNPIDFLIDTGSAKTMISAFDAKNVGIDITKLKPSDKPVEGLGGDVNARDLGECQLVFQLYNTYLVENLDNILVLEKKEERKETSSILGMDILRNYNIRCSGQYIILER